MPKTHLEGQPHGGALTRTDRAGARRASGADEPSPFRSSIVYERPDGTPLPRVMPTRDLRENPDNWRRHPLEQLDAIEASIDEVGWIAGATINLRLVEDGWPVGSQPTMIDGHGRAKVALARGEADVPVGAWVRLSPADEKKALAYFDPITGQADGDAAAYDRLLDTIDTGSAALQQLLADTREAMSALDDLASADVDGASDDQDGQEADEDELDVNEQLAAEYLAKWGCAAGQLWAIDGTADDRTHYLIVGDCTDADTVERLMGERRAAVCVTDPPYNVGIKYGAKVDDGKSRDDYSMFSALWFNQAVDAAGVGCVAFTPGTANLKMWMQDAFQLHLVLPYRWTCSWRKANQCSSSALNGFNAWEPLLVFGRHVKPVGHDAWDIPVRQETVGHPVAKTVKAWRAFVEAFTADDSVVYEPFSGSGTTMLCCEELGRTCFAVEVEPKFAACTLERMEQAGCDCHLIAGGGD